MYNEEELFEIGEDVIKSIDIAISEVSDVEEYADLMELLEEAKALAIEKRDHYSGKLYEEELAERNAEYIAMVS